MPRFPHGQVLCTPNIVLLMGLSESYNKAVTDCLDRHLAADWGDLSDHDKALNDAALGAEGQLRSAYLVGPNNPRMQIRIWIVTEADRKTTTILLPEES